MSGYIHTHRGEHSTLERLPLPALPIPQDQRPSTDDLLEMLSYCRPAGSASEALWIERFVLRLPGAWQDSYGNVIVQIGAQPSTLFSAHTDTVHHTEGLQTVLLDAFRGEVFCADTRSGCLGADDTTGCWLLVQLIRAGKPGLYIFHRDEEIGGWGSEFIAHETPQLLSSIQRAIAFDRKGFNDVITQQAGQRCCSPAFANALAQALQPLVFHPSAEGVFTDTANYIGLVRECTNVSVGYFQQHTTGETQNIHFAATLAHQLVQVDFESLPTVRRCRRAATRRPRKKACSRRSHREPIQQRTAQVSRTTEPAAQAPAKVSPLSVVPREGDKASADRFTDERVALDDELSEHPPDIDDEEMAYKLNGLYALVKLYPDLVAVHLAHLQYGLDELLRELSTLPLDDVQLASLKESRHLADPNDPFELLTACQASIDQDPDLQPFNSA